jgi:hypothetical protein
MWHLAAWWTSTLISKEPAASIFLYAKNRVVTLLQNTDTKLTDYMVSHPKNHDPNTTTIPQFSHELLLIKIICQCEIYNINL